MSERVVVFCNCSGLDHNVVFDYDEQYGELIIHAQLNHYLPWYKRIPLAIRYIFGYDTHRCHYIETVLLKGGNEIQKIKDLLNMI